MRWDQLFADMEARFDELQDAQAAAEQADRDRVAVGAVMMTQRLSGSIDQHVRIRVAGATAVTGTLRSVGPDWLMVEEGYQRESIVALAAVVAVEGVRAPTGPAPEGLALRLNLRHALRAVARDRSPVAVALAGAATGSNGESGAFSDGAREIVGTIDRVGADFIEVAVHAAWEPRRAGSVTSVALLPIGAILLVRALPLG